MFKSRTEGSVVFKCTVRLLEDDEVLECEFQVRPSSGELAVALGSVLISERGARGENRFRFLSIF